jgi:hypothetical protein
LLPLLYSPEENNTVIRKIALAASAVAVAAITTGCAYLPGKVNLAQVASDSGLTNVTTGDGTFENYTATGHYSGTEIGIGVGLPFLIKLFELYPAQTPEQLLTNIGTAAKEDGATAMINVTPNKSLYTGFPFVFVGVYVDQANGTGIKRR